LNISKNIARLNTGVITHYGVSISEYLNYQSIELAKSLLLFSHTERLYKWDEKSIGYLKAYGANCFGNKLDKASWKSRFKWVDDNLDKIVNFRNGELIVKGWKEITIYSFLLSV
jgi:DNA-directed RNA polymerase